MIVFQRGFRLQTPSEYGKIIDVNIAYPRRNFSVVSDIETDTKYFMSQMTLIQHRTWPHDNYVFGYRFDWRKLESKVNRHRLAMLLFHPSFQKVSFVRTGTRYVVRVVCVLVNGFRPLNKRPSDDEHIFTPDFVFLHI